MAAWLDEKYLKLLSHRLDGFAQKGVHRYNCRCPICGDSEKKKNKKRGNFYVHSGSLMYHCFNCNASLRFSTFLKDFDSNLYNQYTVERFKEEMNRTINEDVEKHVPETQKYVPDIFADLPLVSDLKDTHPAKVFCVNRMLPLDRFDFRYAESFIAWTKGYTEKFVNWKGDDHSRIVIPWRDRNDKIIGYSARSFDGIQEQKYYRIFVDSAVKEHFFGMDRLDETKQVYVLEGEIDSLMLDNAVAVANGKLHTYMNKNAIYIPDGDRRNKHICKGISDMIDLGLKVCLLPDGLPGKDLNELVCAGFTNKDLMDIIIKNTFQGLEARLKFNQWKVVSL